MQKKVKRLELRIDAEDRLMLEDLASSRGLSSSELVRSLVRDAYGSQFEMKKPGAGIVSTPRAILEAVTRPEAATVKEIAFRADVPRAAVETLFRKVERENVFARTKSFPDGDELWDCFIQLPELLTLAERRGIRLDTPIELNALSFDVRVLDQEKGVVAVRPVGPSTLRQMPGIKNELRSACRQLCAERQGKIVETKELGGALGAALAPRLGGRGVDVYVTPGRLELSSVLLEA